MNSPITSGANALKLENEVTNESMTDLSSSEIISKNNQNITSSESESIVQDQSLCTHIPEQSFSEEVTETINEIDDSNEFVDQYDDEFIQEDIDITEDQIRALVKIGPPILTRFEKARILGTRALQISMSAPPLLDFEEEKDKDMNDPLLIAVHELEAKVLPISVRRFLPDGRYQDIPLQYLYLDATKWRYRNQQM